MLFVCSEEMLGRKGEGGIRLLADVSYKIKWWRRERRPHILILLKNFLSLIFLPPFLPPNDRLRKADL